jgi:parallel beta-helix repeat protein
MKKILFILFCFLSAAVYSQSTYYVDDDGSDDTGDGSIGNPWATLEYADNQMTGGDTLYIRAGTYTERFYISGLSGTSGNHTYISAYNGEAAIIDGTGISYGSGSGFFTIASNYVDFVDMEVRNANMTGATGGINLITLTGQYITIDNCTLHDAWGMLVHIANDNNIVQNCTGYNSSMSNQDLVAQPSEIWHNAIAVRGNSSDTVKHCTINDNYLYDCCGEGYTLAFADSCTVEDNIITNTFSVAIYIRNSQNCTIQRNFVYSTLSAGIGYGNENTNTFESEKVTIINNIAQGGKRNLYVDCIFDAGSIIAFNTFINSTYQYNVRFNEYAHTGGDFKNNIIVQEDATPLILVVDDQDIDFSYNLWNKSYDSDAVGTGDVTTTDHIIKTGTVSDTSYYRLVSESGAVGGGIAVSGITEDYEGTVRGDPPDIGALEYSATGGAPNVVTGQAYNISTSGCVVIGNNNDDGGGTVSAKGVCYNTTGSPDINDDTTDEGSGAGTFSSTLSGLTENTTYYVAAYATNEHGTGYGDVVSFTTRKGGVIIGGDGNVTFIKGKIYIKK